MTLASVEAFAKCTGLGGAPLPRSRQERGTTETLRSLLAGDSPARDGPSASVVSTQNCNPKNKHTFQRVSPNVARSGVGSNDRVPGHTMTPFSASEGNHFAAGCIICRDKTGQPEHSKSATRDRLPGPLHLHLLGQWRIPLRSGRIFSERNGLNGANCRGREQVCLIPNRHQVKETRCSAKAADQRFSQG